MTREEAIEFLITTQNISPEHMMELLEALESEPTYEQLKDYCRKRHLIILTDEAYETLVHYYNTRTPQQEILKNIMIEIDEKQYDFMEDGDYSEGIRFGLMLADQIIHKHTGLTITEVGE